MVLAQLTFFNPKTPCNIEGGLVKEYEIFSLFKNFKTSSGLYYT